ncbi:MAG: hypothetical protein RJB55_2021, partial [Verrucomicrobiota bacterium]
NPEAQSRLGVWHAGGQEGLAKDTAQAANWFRRAADQGFADAQFMLGIKLARGEGLPRDTVESAAWLQVATWNGHAEAARRLSLSREAFMPATEAAVQKRAKELSDGIRGPRK